MAFIKKLAVISGAMALFMSAPVSPAFANTAQENDSNNSTVDTTTTIPDDALLVSTGVIGDKGATINVYNESVDYETRVIEDSSLPDGSEIIVSEGDSGVVQYLQISRDIRNGNGETDSIISENSKVIVSPTTEVVRVGVGEIDTTEHVAPVLLERWEEEEQERLDREAEEREQEEREVAEREERERDSSDSNREDNESSQNSDNTENSNGTSEYADAVRSDVTCGGWDELILEHFGEAEYVKACSVLMCESTGNPQAQNPVSTASGLFQFLDTTWQATRVHVGSDASRAIDASPEKQVEAARWLSQNVGWSQWVCQ